MLHALVQRAGVANCKNVVGVFAARPGDAFALLHRERELHVKGDLDARADDLPIALQRVAVANVKERAFGQHRKVDRHPFYKAPVVHIAPVLGGGGCRDSLAPGWGYAKTADHRGQRQR